MPTAVHDIFTARVVEGIREWINSIRHRTDLASSVVSSSTSQIFLHGDADDDRKGPPQYNLDAAFTHVNAVYPSVVIET
jgi:hypothetical protein